MILFLLFVIIFSLAIGLGLPALAFFTVPNAAQSMGQAFTAEGWGRFTAYLSSSPNWDRWFMIVCGAVSIFFWLVVFIKLLVTNHPLKGIFSIFGLALDLLIIYVYLAWPNNADFALWQKIIIYICVGIHPLSMLSQAFGRTQQ